MQLARANYCAAACSANADRIADGNIPESDRTIDRYWDFSAFVLPPLTDPRAGNGGRNILVGPGLNNWDLGIFKTFAACSSTLPGRTLSNNTMKLRPGSVFTLRSVGNRAARKIPFAHATNCSTLASTEVLCVSLSKSRSDFITLTFSTKRDRLGPSILTSLVASVVAGHVMVAKISR